MKERRGKKGKDLPGGVCLFFERSHRRVHSSAKSGPTRLPFLKA
jgi:hypothetical protein